VCKVVSKAGTVTIVTAAPGSGKCLPADIVRGAIPKGAPGPVALAWRRGRFVALKHVAATVAVLAVLAGGCAPASTRPARVRCCCRRHRPLSTRPCRSCRCRSRCGSRRSGAQSSLVQLG